MISELNCDRRRNMTQWCADQAQNKVWDFEILWRGKMNIFQIKKNCAAYLIRTYRRQPQLGGILNKICLSYRISQIQEWILGLTITMTTVKLKLSIDLVYCVIAFHWKRDEFSVMRTKSMFVLRKQSVSLTFCRHDTDHLFIKSLP